jgi:hypothetical protein
LGEELEVFDDRRNLGEVVKRELLPLVCNVIALGVDDAQDEVGGILVIRVKGVLVAVSVSEIASECTEGHAIHCGFAFPVGALYIHRKPIAGGSMGKGQVGIEILVLAELDFQSVFLGELDEHRKQEKLQDFRDNLRVNGDGIDALVNVDEAFDDPFSFVRGNGLGERGRVLLEMFEKLFRFHRNEGDYI